MDTSRGVAYSGNTPGSIRLAPPGVPAIQRSNCSCRTEYQRGGLQSPATCTPETSITLQPIRSWPPQTRPQPTTALAWQSLQLRKRPLPQVGSTCRGRGLALRTSIRSTCPRGVCGLARFLYPGVKIVGVVAHAAADLDVGRTGTVDAPALQRARRNLQLVSGLFGCEQRSHGLPGGAVRPTADACEAVLLRGRPLDGSQAGQPRRLARTAPAARNSQRDPLR